MQIAAGRSFSKQMAADDTAAFILNEAAVKELGWGKAENAIGKSFDWGLGKQGNVIGVVKDFHFNSLQEKIPAIVMHISPSWHKYLSLRIAPGEMKSLLPIIEQTWKKYLPAQPFEYTFVDEDFAKQYEAEERLGKLTTLGSFLTIFIACLGLFGLTIFSAEQRSREISMRKVLGASISQIIILLCKDFAILIVLPFLIATPLAYYAIHAWLENFAYHIEIRVQTFFLAGVASLLLAWLTACKDTDYEIREDDMNIPSLPDKDSA